VPFEIEFTIRGQSDFNRVAAEPALAKRFKAVRKTLGLLQNNPRHPGLSKHKFSDMSGPNGEDVFEAYAENNTPGAFRVFWVYCPGKNVITVIAVTPHP
jgi:hypothetical protein